jgi:hypothetical protein
MHFFKNNVSVAGSASVFSKKGEEVPPLPPPFYLKTEAEPAPETLFLKKKHLTVDTVQK